MEKDNVIVREDISSVAQKSSIVRIWLPQQEEDEHKKFIADFFEKVNEVFALDQDFIKNHSKFFNYTDMQNVSQYKLFCLFNEAGLLRIRFDPDQAFFRWLKVLSPAPR